MTAPVRHLEDRSGRVYDFVAVVPGVDVSVAMLPEGSRPAAEASVDAATGRVAVRASVPVGATGARGPQGVQGPKGDKGDKGDTGTSVSGVSFDRDGGLTVRMSDGTAVEFGGVTTAIAAAQAATTSATEAAGAANEAAGAANEAARDANDAENKRASAEQARVSAEAARADAESKREAAETAREARLEATEGVVGGFDARLTTVESVLRVGYTSMTPAQVQVIVQAGEGARYFPVGTQLTVPWEYEGKKYDFVWDVVHHYDGSDEAHPLRRMADGTERPAMCIQAHYALPVDVQFSAREAFCSPSADMPAGTYHFAVRVTATWSGTAGSVAATVGTRQYRFATTKAHPAGAQLVWDARHDAPVAKVTVYDEPMGTEASEKCAVTETTSPTGTDLGTMSELESGDGLNNVERACEGSNRWATSSLRAFLNSEDAAWRDSPTGRFHRKADCDGRPGVLGGFDEDFRAVLGEVANLTQPHPFDGDGADETHDTLFLPSAREHGFSNYLSNTADGFQSEGVPWDYWTRLARASGIPDGIWKGWQSYPELVTYGLDGRTLARIAWGRSAYRENIYASTPGCVLVSGTISHAYARTGRRAAPSACIA